MSGPDQKSELADVVFRNIEALVDARTRFEREKSFEHRLADRIANFTGSLHFVVVHVILIFTLIAFRLLSFSTLSMIASVEALILTAFVLINQRRMAELAEKRANLDLQINLLSEHEITRLIHLVDTIANHLGVVEKGSSEPELKALKKDVSPTEVLEELEAAERKNAERG